MASISEVKILETFIRQELALGQTGAKVEFVYGLFSYKDNLCPSLAFSQLLLNKSLLLSCSKEGFSSQTQASIPLQCREYNYPKGFYQDLYIPTVLFIQSALLLTRLFFNTQLEIPFPLKLQ